MPDPSSTLRQMIIMQSEIDMDRVQSLCEEITDGIEDPYEAHRLISDTMAEIEALCLSMEMGASSETIRRFRDDALEAAGRMIKAALG